ncbi:MAG TPA: TRAM domain-containing protein [Nitrospiria bacterium]|jgi:uncharacterized protein YacL
MAAVIGRLVFLLVSALAGFYVFLKGFSDVHSMVGAGVGGLIALFVISLEFGFQKLSTKVVLGGLLGLLAGMVSAGVILFITESLFFDGGKFLAIWQLFALALFSYLGIVLGIRWGKLPGLGFISSGRGEETQATNNKILDTSTIIDGRIADLCETGFLDGTFIIPHFILQELQHIADSSDSMKRARGRRGLDILHRIQKMSEIDVQLVENDFPHIREVDAKLVALGKEILGKIVTNDLNLNKVAELQGVRVLNINSLCNALKPVVLPGETMRVFVLKEGKEAGQGVAYLDDGTMIVVDDARRYIGRNVDVVVTSVLQTTAGRMIFTRLKDESEKEELKVARG